MATDPLEDYRPRGPGDPLGKASDGREGGEVLISAVAPARPARPCPASLKGRLFCRAECLPEEETWGP